MPPAIAQYPVLVGSITLQLGLPHFCEGISPA